MHGAATPRHDPCLPAASPDDTPRPGWPASAPTTPLVKMPSERLVRAVLANMSGWLDSLAEIEHFALPGTKSRIMQLRRAMTQSRISFMRLVDAPEAEIQAALKQANEDAGWPRADE